MDISPPHRRSSTPPSHQQRVSMSSPSSGLPSPSGFFSEKAGGALKSGSRVTQPAEGAFTGFATAASLVKSKQLSLDAEDFAAQRKPKQQRRKLADVDVNTAAPKKASKRSAKASNIDDAEAKKPRKRKEATDIANSKSTASKIDVSTTFHSSANPPQGADPPAPQKSRPKPRKPRVSKEKPETQPKLKKGKITKPGTSTNSDTSNAKLKGLEFVQEYNFGPKATGVKSTHFPQTAIDTSPISGISPAGLEKAINVQSAAPAVRDTILSATAQAAQTSSEEKDAIVVNASLSLEVALKRRTDWTPTRNTEAVLLDGITPDNQFGDSPAHKRPAFTSILANYAYSHTSQVKTTEPPTRQVSGEGLTKRRRVELVGIPAMHANPPEVTKALKRKATTITDLVTGPYRPNVQGDVTSGVIDKVFSPRIENNHVSTAPGVSANPSPVMKPPRKRAPREKSPTKANAKTKKPAKQPKSQPKFAADKLLSPASAVRRMNKQEILFGTSSQLARDDSPRFIRQIQQAIRESEAEAEANATIHDQHKNAVDVSNSLRSQKLSALTTRRALWSAAARDDDNKLLEGDDLFWNPAATSPREEPNIKPEKDSFVNIDTLNFDRDASATQQDSFIDIDTLNTYRDATAHQRDSGFYSIEEFSNSEESASRANSVVKDHFSAEICRPNGPDNESTHDQDGFLNIEDVKPYADDTQQDPASASVIARHTTLLQTKKARASKSRADVTREPAVKKPRGRPAKPTPTSTSPTKKVKRVKASPKKKPQPPPDKPSHPLPSTPPRKKKTLNFVHIDEIQDSEAESPFSPSPPRRAYGNPSSPLQLRPSPPKPAPGIDQAKLDLEAAEKLKAEKLAAAEAARAAKAEAARLAEEAMRQDLFPKISTVLKGAPRATDPSKPSWYEKILMYDPIVLEDLTAWLIAQGVRWSGTIKRKGKGKKKASETEAVGEEGDTEVVVRELDEKMVQKFCEEYSICCLYREGKKGW